MNEEGQPETLEEALGSNGGLEKAIEDSVVPEEVPTSDELGEISPDEQSIISPEEL